jgi:hypothetical protein
MRPGSLTSSSGTPAGGVERKLQTFLLRADGARWDTEQLDLH